MSGGQEGGSEGEGAAVCGVLLDSWRLLSVARHKYNCTSAIARHSTQWTERERRLQLLESVVYVT